MQGSVAQMAVLVTYGNAFLQNFQGQPAVECQARNSTFKFCDSVRFVDSDRQALFSDVRGWFEALKKEGVRGLGLRYEPSTSGLTNEIITVAFAGGGGRWFIEEHRNEHYRWRDRWILGDRERKDRKIWQVLYQRSVSSDPAGKIEPDLGELKSASEKIIADIARFARSVELTSFATCFESGLSRINATKPLEGLPYHGDIAPSDFLSLNAQQLLGAVLSAWVFGGMGSWNDVPIPNERHDDYRKLSDELYRQLIRAVVGAVNLSSQG